MYVCMYVSTYVRMCAYLLPLLQDFSVTDMRGWTPAHHAAYHGQLRTLLVGYLKFYVSRCHDNGFAEFDHDTVPYNMYGILYGSTEWQMYAAISCASFSMYIPYIHVFVLYVSLSIMYNVLTLIAIHT